MAVEKNLAVLDAIEDAFRVRDWDRFLSHFAHSVVYTFPGNPEPIMGRAAFRQFIEEFVKGFPDIEFQRQRAFGQGDWVCAEYEVTGTHLGVLKGPGGQEIPATGKATRYPNVFLLRFEAGEIAEVRDYHDDLSIMAQLGPMPPPSA